MELIPVLEFLEDKEHLTDGNFVTNLPRHRLDADTKQKVLTYLNNKDFAQWWSDPITFENPFTGKQSRITGYAFNDGKYKWNCHLPVYVHDHDVKLPDDFIERAWNILQAKKT